jgi:hypothetical protein
MGVSQLAPSFIARKRALDCASLQAPTCLRSPSGRPGSLRANLWREVSRRSPVTPAGNPPSMGVSQLAPIFIARKRARDYASLQAPTCLRSPSGRPGSLRVNLWREVSRRAHLALSVFEWVTLGVVLTCTYSCRYVCPQCIQQNKRSTCPSATYCPIDSMKTLYSLPCAGRRTRNATSRLRPLEKKLGMNRRHTGKDRTGRLDFIRKMLRIRFLQGLCWRNVIGLRIWLGGSRDIWLSIWRWLSWRNGCGETVSLRG